MYKYILGLAAFCVILIACTSGDDSGDSSADTTQCADTSAVTQTTTQNSNGCYLLSRDTSSCQSEREDQGLSGYWLQFSCNVTLTVSGSKVLITTENTPDYDSYYYGESLDCYEDFSISGRNPNPGSIGQKSATMTVDAAPSTSSSTTEMPEGVVGIATNGVFIFDNEAGGTDNIYDEVSTFDTCDGHPAFTTYHYHIEPPSITQSDSNFVGIMRDGFPIFGINESDSTEPTDLDDAGGHTGTLHDGSGDTGYHYHVNLQSGTDGRGDAATAYFITKGQYRGTAGSCSGCDVQ